MAQELVLNPEDIWPSGLFSDLTLVCDGEGEEFAVHRIVLHAKSPVFRKLLDGKFKESTTSATRIELPDDDPAYLYTLLDWLYKSVYTNYTCDIDMPYSVFAVHIYAIADKYGVDALRKKAAGKLSENPFGDIYYDDLVGVLRAIEECTNPKDTTLWDIVLPKVKDNINLLLKDEDFTNLICEKPEINLRILKAFGGESIGGSRLDDTSPDRAAASSPTDSVYIFDP